MGDERKIGEGSWDEGMRAAFRQAAKASGSSVLARIEAKAGQAPRVLLRDVPDEHTPVMKLRTAETRSVSDRYQVMGEIARGGVGVIYKGRDIDLGRDVAMKILLEQHAENPELIQRFVEEAQVGGQLQHPGIVPVYELGLQEDGRPYFAMKLIKGQTPSALLSARTEPGRGRRRFLTIFEQVCQTMAYAHARGVIHRDLKPSNVMVGPFGEVQIVDWGFAKILGQGGVADERRAALDLSVIQTVRSVGEGSAPSVAGSVMGTPAYMPPEQALGEVEKLDERSDVFSLGAILCEIVTGKPLYTGEKERLLIMAAQCKLDEVYRRLDECGADGKLVELVKRCTAADQTARPADAGVVARAVGNHLASVEDRARAAQVAAAEARVKAQEERRARRLTLALAATVLLAAILGGGSWYLVEQEKENKREALRAQVTKEMDQAREAHARATLVPDPADLSLWPDAIQAAQAALELSKELGVHADRTAEFLTKVRQGKAAAEVMARTVKKDRLMVERLIAIGVRSGRDFEMSGIDSDYLEAFQQYGLDAEKLPPDRLAAAIKKTTIVAELGAALDDWAAARKEANTVDLHAWKPLAETARLLDGDAWRTRVRYLVEGGEMGQLQTLADEEDLHALPAESVYLLGEALRRIGDNQMAVKVLSVAQAKDPYAFWPNFRLAWSIFRQPEPNLDDAVNFFETALKKREEAGARYHLAAALNMRGDIDNAITAWREVERNRPGFGKVKEHLAEALVKKSRIYREGRFFESAEQAAREAIRLQPDNVAAHFHLGQALLGPLEGTIAEAFETLEEAMEIDREAWRAHVSFMQILRDAGDLDQRLEDLRDDAESSTSVLPRLLHGHALLARRDFDGAAGAYREAARIDPKLSMPHFMLASVFADGHRKDRKARIAALRDYTRLASDQAHGHSLLSHALRQEKRYGEAQEEIEAAIRLEPNVHDGALAWIHFFKGENRSAIEVLERAWIFRPLGFGFRRNWTMSLLNEGLDRAAGEVCRQFLERHTESAHATGSLALVHALATDETVRDPRKAVALGREAIELEPQRAYPWADLFHVLCEAGRWQEALDALEQHLSLRKKEPDKLRVLHLYAALAHWHAGDKETAREQLKKGNAYADTLEGDPYKWFQRLRERANATVR